MRRSQWIVCCALMAGCNCSDGGGGGGGEPATPAARVERALKQFGTDARENAPVVRELERALTLRLTTQDVTVIVAQYLQVLEAVSRHGRPVADPQFLALVQKLSDLPYFDEFARALLGSDEAGTDGGQSGQSGGDGGAPLPPPGSYGTMRAALEGPTCDSNCALKAFKALYLQQGLGILMGFNDRLDAAANGTSCTDQTVALYQCKATGDCSRSNLGDLAVSCYQTVGSLAGIAVGVSTAPFLVGSILLLGGTAGILSTAQHVDEAEVACDEYQALHCCVGQIKCGGSCCSQGFACLAAGVCSRNSANGCQTGEKPCGLYCCGAGQLCAGDTTCVPTPVCLGATRACGTACCNEGERCDFDGACHACDPGSLCGGTVCCQDGRFCNELGQCLVEPEGGCGPVCGTLCCPPGQTCSSGACTGERVACPDGACSPGFESPLSCVADCPSRCGDDTCQDWETATTCKDDCSKPACGDGQCGTGEATSCPADCPRSSCGDGKCDVGESCPADCGVNAYDGVWSVQMEVTRCGTITGTGSITIRDGNIVGASIFKFTADAYSPAVRVCTTDCNDDCVEEYSITGGTVSARGAIDGTSMLAGNCCDGDDSFYGSMKSPTSGTATSFWGSLTFTKQ